jgi:hypothetical protein
MRNCYTPLIGELLDKKTAGRETHETISLKGHSHENNFEIITLNDRLDPN